MELDYLLDFEDYFPSMIAHMGAEGFIGELCNGFRLLMDVTKGLITFESLKTNCYLLGMDARDDELACMLMEGDLDGDGALSQMEFCILMFRLSPCLMDAPPPPPAPTKHQHQHQPAPPPDNTMYPILM